MSDKAERIVDALLNDHDISDTTHGNYDAETFRVRIRDTWIQRVDAALLGECSIPPLGWRCTRQAPHDGPCAAVRTCGDGE